jgi:hypothetical protein
MAAWMDWARGCSGDLDAEDPGCALHAWNAAVQEFIRLIDEDWYRNADFYRTPQRDVTGLDVRELCEPDASDRGMASLQEPATPPVPAEQTGPAQDGERPQ